MVHGTRRALGREQVEWDENESRGTRANSQVVVWDMNQVAWDENKSHGT